MPATVRTCLILLAASLLVVGFASGTILRHLVQIIPIVMALSLLRRQPAAAGPAATALFLFWLAIVILIWMFLLGLSRIANGRYSAVEIASTIVMAVSSSIGLVKSIPLGRPMPMASRAGMFLLFTVIQVIVMRLSFSSAIANR